MAKAISQSDVKELMQRLATCIVPLNMPPSVDVGKVKDGVLIGISMGLTAEDLKDEPQAAIVQCGVVELVVHREEVEKQRRFLAEWVEQHFDPAMLSQGPSFMQIAKLVPHEKADAVAVSLLAAGKVLGFWELDAINLSEMDHEKASKAILSEKSCLWITHFNMHGYLKFPTHTEQPEEATLSHFMAKARRASTNRRGE